MNFVPDTFPDSSASFRPKSHISNNLEMEERVGIGHQLDQLTRGYIDFQRGIKLNLHELEPTGTYFHLLFTGDFTGDF